MSASPVALQGQADAILELDLCPMDEALLPGVMAIENVVYAYPWTEGIFRDCLRAGYCCWLMRDGARVVGYAVLSVAAGESHLLNVCVDLDYRRRGIARVLVDHLLELAERHHAEVVFLEVRPSNRGALRMYRDMGFDEVGVRGGYYPAPNGREDALVMARSLGDGVSFTG